MPQDDEKPPTIFVLSVPPVLTATTTSSEKGSTLLFSQPAPSWPPIPVPPLDTVEYEAEMFFWAIAIALDPMRWAGIGNGWRNAASENAVLHARNLCRMFLNNGEPGEIRLSEVLDDLKVPFAMRRRLRPSIKKLRKVYGTRRDPDSAAFAFNEMVMHTSKLRGGYGLYADLLQRLREPIREIVDEIQVLANRTFVPIE